MQVGGAHFGCARVELYSYWLKTTATEDNEVIEIVQMRRRSEVLM